MENNDIESIEGLPEHWALPVKIKNHLITITKNRTIKLINETDHLSAAHILEALSKIDQPCDYDFQKKDVYEQEFLSYLLRFVPFMLYGREDDDDGSPEDAIAGKSWFTLKEGNSDRPRCHDCTAPLYLSFKGNEVKIISNTPCEHNQVFTVEIDFPTGKVVYADWPNRFSEAKDAGFIQDRDHESVNYLKGQRQASHEFEKQQILHHSVGNTCPSLFYNKNTHQIQIGGGEYDEETDEKITTNDFENLGYFCTDLWWVTMIDKKFYDQIMKKLPNERNTKYYTTDVKVATIEPGRYRFTCYGRTGDDYDMVHATAERIGEVSDFIPVFDPLGDDRLMTVEEAVSASKSFTTKLSLIEYVFNCNGNGINSKGDFYSKFKLNGQNIKAKPLGKMEADLSKFTPYPNYKENYSLLYEMNIEDIPTDWLEAAQEFYQISVEYFMGDAQTYSHAYPGTQKHFKNTDEILAMWEKQYRKKGMNDADYYAAVSKAMECEFDGDIDKHSALRWQKEKARCLAFCNKTVEYIQKELDKRNK